MVPAATSARPRRAVAKAKPPERTARSYRPDGLVASGGTIFVADSYNDRIDSFTPAGSFIGAFGKNVGGAGINSALPPGSAPKAPPTLKRARSTGPGASPLPLRATSRSPSGPAVGSTSSPPRGLHPRHRGRRGPGRRGCLHRSDYLPAWGIRVRSGSPLRAARGDRGRRREPLRRRREREGEPVHRSRRLRARLR